MPPRPPNPAAERAAQNQQTIKTLLKLESNKICADCKRNKHPRWASWNLGVFVCIRCSGIHRGMGTHISRVKSVDLDAWTDEQLQSVLNWGNARANKYWEAKLAHGHAPSEAKIENFIRTKYELKRWVMDGPMPDPSTLDADGEDDLPLSVVKEKQNMERKDRKPSANQPAAVSRQPQSLQGDLLGGDSPVPPRASTAGPTATKPPPRADAARARVASNKDSLLGLEFMGPTSAAPPRPASATTPAVSGTGSQSRPDLKQSILSLYASAPRPQAQPQAQAQASGAGGMFGGQPPAASSQQPQSSFSGLDDAFSSLSFNSSAGPRSPQGSGFSSMSSPPIGQPSPPQAVDPFSNLGGGNFFASKPAQTMPAHQPKKSLGSSGGFGSLISPAPASTSTTAPRAGITTSTSAMGDLFDLSEPTPQPALAPTGQPSSPPMANSVFNLSSAQQPKPQQVAAPSGSGLGSMGTSSWSNSDVWGGNAWGAPDTNTSAAASMATTSTAPKSAISPPAVSGAGANDFGWGAPAGGSLASQSIVPGASGGFNTAPKVAADEEFGGWSGGATPSAGPGPGAGAGTGAPPKPSNSGGGFGASEDLFSNVWQ